MNENWCQTSRKSYRWEPINQELQNTCKQQQPISMKNGSNWIIQKSLIKRSERKTDDQQMSVSIGLGWYEVYNMLDWLSSIISFKTN